MTADNRRQSFTKFDPERGGGFYIPVPRKVFQTALATITVVVLGMGGIGTYKLITPEQHEAGLRMQAVESRIQVLEREATARDDTIESIADTLNTMRGTIIEMRTILQRMESRQTNGNN